MTFLGLDPADTNHNWKEWQIQSYVIMMARRHQWIIHGDQNGASKTNPGMAKVTGSLPGWPDLAIVASLGLTVWVELKISGGRLSKEQTALHAQMRANGHDVYVIYAKSPEDAWEQIKRLPNTGGMG